jgi:hypothetical protein
MNTGGCRLAEIFPVGPGTSAVTPMASGFVDGAGELVGLHSDQTYESAVLALCEAPNNSLYGNERVGLIADFDIDIDCRCSVPAVR